MNSIETKLKWVKKWVTVQFWQIRKRIRIKILCLFYWNDISGSYSSWILCAPKKSRIIWNFPHHTRNAQVLQCTHLRFLEVISLICLGTFMVFAFCTIKMIWNFKMYCKWIARKGFFCGILCILCIRHFVRQKLWMRF